MFVGRAIDDSVVFFYREVAEEQLAPPHLPGSSRTRTVAPITTVPRRSHSAIEGFVLLTILLCDFPGAGAALFKLWPKAK